MIGASSLCFKLVIIYHAYDYHLQNVSFSPSNLIPVQTQLSNQGIPTQFLPWQETLQSQFYSAF